ETRNMEAFLQLLAEKKVNVDRLITHRFPVERAQSAYELITAKSREPFLGVVIQYSGTYDGSPTLELVPQTAVVAPSSEASVDGLAVGLLGAGVFATGTLLPSLKAAANTALVGVC